MRFGLVPMSWVCSLLCLAAGSRLEASDLHVSAQRQMVRAINERQLTVRLMIQRRIVVIDARLPREQTGWTIRCARCITVSVPYDFDNDGWTLATADERYIQNVRADSDLMDTLKQHDVIVVCLEGVRAGSAASALAQLGLNVTVLAGGLNGLKQPWLLGRLEPFR